MNRTNKLLIFLVVMLMISGAVYLLLRSEESSQQTPVPKEPEIAKARLAVAHGLITTPVLIALRKDFFAGEGLEIEVTGEFSSGKGAFDHMLEGNADFSTPATTPVVLNSFSRSDYEILVTYTTTYEGVKMVGRLDRGIRMARDLKGKTIGIVRGTISEILSDILLTYHKILPEEVTVRGYKAQELPSALTEGEVDAISVWEPHAFTAIFELPGIAFQVPTSNVYRIAVNMAVMKEFAERHPETLEKTIRALVKAVDFIREEEAEAQKIVADILQMDKNLVSKLWQDLNFSISLDQQLILTMENEAAWILNRRGEADSQIPNYLDYINYQALEKVEAGKITLIRDSK